MVTSIVLISTFNIVASVSRLVWAFARDNGLPFARHFTHVCSLLRLLTRKHTSNNSAIQIHPVLQVPLPALLLVGTICCLLSLINLGSAVAFNALVALPTIALYVSYAIPITLLTLRQLRGKHPTYGPWRLGRWSIPIKLFSLCYLIYVITFVPFPTSRPVTSETMNYAGPVLGGVIVLAFADWFLRGRKRFRVPTKALEDEVERS